ncbi:hypothetical protein QYE76_038451 [Lolium multiflorum]|uniref:Retrotransposon gag domain-containing protein n=1 Tax=Lolium multiflorum TaxID=4521 RepID=A0AAD8T9K1_LOLMU|nr:hypothetical protein QYE76_038451 [Lolium multiflorum]
MKTRTVIMVILKTNPLLKSVVLVVALDMAPVVVVFPPLEATVFLHNRKDDGLGKPKFSIPKFERGPDVEDYRTWELKIEKLWRLHDCTEDRKIKLASSEFDGYALHWWDGITRARQEDGEVLVLTWREMKAIMHARFVPTNYLRSIYDKLTLLRQGTLMVDAYFLEMEMLMQRGHVRESLEMTMQHFLHGLKYNMKGIVHHHRYTTMNELLHHAREAESKLAEEAKMKGCAIGAGRYTPRAPPPMRPAPSFRPATFPTSSSKPVSNVSNTKKPEPTTSGSGSSMSTVHNRYMACHTCGGKDHFKRDCSNRKVMFINEDNEYEDNEYDADLQAPKDDDYDSDSVDAYLSKARTIVVSQRALNVQPSASTQRCNLFQTKPLVGPDKACKVIIDGGSCRNLASKELYAKLKLKYLPHPHQYYIHWLSDNGEMKQSNTFLTRYRSGGTPCTARTCARTLRDDVEGPGPTAVLAPRLFVLLNHCSPVGFGSNTFWHARWDTFYSNHVNTCIQDGGRTDQVRRSACEHKKKYDELKAIFEADLIGSFEDPFARH